MEGGFVVSQQKQATAAIRIQRAWRRHVDIQVFRYYKDLVSFQCRGEPAVMLRCINPREAELLDAAAGVHVKFRLAGERFPPNIYYKVFTHRNVADMCAFSPKDYTRVDTKLLTGKQLNNRTDTDMVASGRPGWYKRFENNGWRLVSDRILHSAINDPITFQTTMKHVEFSHEKLLRREDVARRRKRRKIEWMRKMHRDGMLAAGRGLGADTERTETSQTLAADPATLHPRSTGTGVVPAAPNSSAVVAPDCQETEPGSGSHFQLFGAITGAEVVGGRAAGAVGVVGAEFGEEDVDREIDEMIEWTTGLDYDDYIDHWKSCATSAASDKSVYERLQRRFRLTEDPFELALSTEPESLSSPQFARQSHNTPASGRHTGEHGPGRGNRTKWTSKDYSGESGILEGRGSSGFGVFGSRGATEAKVDTPIPQVPVGEKVVDGSGGSHSGDAELDEFGR